MQTIRFNSTGDDVRVLQQLLQQWGYDIPVTGYFYELTDKFVRDFQTKHDLDVDGIVGRCTWDALMDSESRAMYAMLVTEADFRRNAEELGVDVAAVMAVKEVESSGKGFLAPNKPVILFEGHIFWSQLKDRGINPEDTSKATRTSSIRSGPRNTIRVASLNTTVSKERSRSMKRLQSARQVGASSR